MALEGHVDAVQVSDNAGANLQLSGMIAAYLLQKKGLETILQMSCRDRNRSQLQADVLGACGMGVKSILCQTENILERAITQKSSQYSTLIRLT